MSGSVKLQIQLDQLSLYYEHLLHNNIVDGQTYKFSTLHLKSHNGKVSLGTTQTGCSIEPCDQFPDLKPPKELPSTIKTEQLEVFGISNVALYHVCPTYTKKSSY